MRDLEDVASEGEREYFITITLKVCHYWSQIKRKVLDVPPYLYVATYCGGDCTWVSTLR